MNAAGHSPQRTTTQLILAWMEHARMERQIQRLRTGEHDEAHLRALEDCRTALLRMGSRRSGPAAPESGAAA